MGEDANIAIRKGEGRTLEIPFMCSLMSEEDEMAIHWPKNSHQCWCGPTFSTPSELRKHLYDWCSGLRRIQFKHNTLPDGSIEWVSTTPTPFHVIKVGPDKGLYEGRQWRIWCICGWEQGIDLFQLETMLGNTPARLALGHIRGVVEEVFRDGTGNS